MESKDTATNMRAEMKSDLRAMDPHHPDRSEQLDERFERVCVACRASGNEREVVCILIHIHGGGRKVGGVGTHGAGDADDIVPAPGIPSGFAWI